MTHTQVDFLGKTFTSPLIGSSGTVGYGSDFLAIQPSQVAQMYGGLTLKTITPEPLLGNPSPRVCETEYGMINSIGLQNKGLDSFKKVIYPKIIDLKTQFPSLQIIASVAAFTNQDFSRMVAEFSQLEKIDMIEMNVSCPNISYHNRNFSSDPILLQEVLKDCSRLKKDKPLIVKLSPNHNDLMVMAKVSQESGADALSLTNTFLGLKIDVDTRRPMIGNVIGGYSGPAIKPIVLAMVYQVTQEVGLPVIGIGGVLRGEDVVEYLLAGASMVGVGTSNFIDPRGITRIYKGFTQYLKKHRLNARELKKINP